MLNARYRSSAEKREVSSAQRLYTTHILPSTLLGLDHRAVFPTRSKPTYKIGEVGIEILHPSKTTHHLLTCCIWQDRSEVDQVMSINLVEVTGSISV